MNTTNQYPSQVKFIVGNELCERFSFYGMRSILVIFMTQHLLVSQVNAKTAYHLFVSGCYLLPLFGAYLSDKYWGRYKTILYLSLFYCLGHGTLALWESETGLYVGLALIAFGCGGIKPCVSAYVGDQFNKSNAHLINNIYNIFYWSINLGSFTSTLLIPWILPRYGASVAFAIPGILMGIATFIFWLGRKQYVHIPPTGKSGGFMPVFLSALTGLKSKKAGETFWDLALRKHTSEEVEAAKSVVEIFKVYITVSVFWALFDQHGSSWTLQANKMDLNIFGLHFEASQIAALNPIMVMTLIPLFSYVIYPGIEKFGIQMTPLRKMSAGMFITAFSFVVVGLLEEILNRGQSLSAGWQIIPYLLITMGEVMVSITGLEFAYTQAPRSMKSTIMSFWLLTTFAGNLLTAYISKINAFEGAHYFYFFAALMGGVSLIFVWNASRYKIKSFDETHARAEDHLQLEAI